MNGKKHTESSNGYHGFNVPVPLELIEAVASTRVPGEAAQLIWFIVYSIYTGSNVYGAADPSCCNS